MKAYKGRVLDEWMVRRSLSRKHDVEIRGFEILILRGKQAVSDIGNKSWGCIDFLVNHCGYRRLFVKEFPKF